MVVRQTKAVTGLKNIFFPNLLCKEMRSEKVINSYNDTDFKISTNTVKCTIISNLRTQLIKLQSYTQTSQNLKTLEICSNRLQNLRKGNTYTSLPFIKVTNTTK
jgi:hypothetical protein